MYWQKGLSEPDPNEEIEKEILSISQEHNGNYGYRRIRLELRRRGHIVNHKKVRRIMKKLNLTCTSFGRKSRKYNSYKGRVGTTASNLLNRRFNTTMPYQKITTDTTEFKYYVRNDKNQIVIKKAFLDPFLDMYSGEILSFGFSQRPSASSIHQALEEVIHIVKNCKYRTTIHSDQGWAYQMKTYQNMLKENKIFQSMSRKGNCLDNAPIENFFGLLKQEMYYGKIYTSFEELEQEITKYIHYYNHARIKEKLAGMSPVEYRLHTSQSIN